MRRVSPSFLSAVRGSHQALFRARLVAPGQTGVDPEGTEIPILSGNVVFDTTASITSTLDLTTDLSWPETPTSPGNPYGTEIYVERGVRYGASPPEYVGLGYFRVDSVDQDKAPKGVVRISGSDRMSSVVDGKPIYPVQYLAGASVSAMLDQVLGDVIPGLVSDYDDGIRSAILSTSFVMSEDRYKFVREVLDAYGRIGYFDYAGRFQVRPVPDPMGQPVWDINTGRDGVLLSMRRSLSRDGVYNAVVASGDSVGGQHPVRGIATDDGPGSPTRWGGPFGKVPTFFSSSLMTSDGQCGNAARAMLRRITGLPYEVYLDAVPNPALEGWDVVRVRYGGATDETHVVTKVSYDLSAQGSMRIDTRKQFLNGENSGH